MVCSMVGCGSETGLVTRRRLQFLLRSVDSSLVKVRLWAVSSSKHHYVLTHFLSVALSEPTDSEPTDPGQLTQY